MFTGIIEEIGEIRKLTPISGGKKFDIFSDLIGEDTRVNDSICVNGVCLTVTKIHREIFTVDAVGVTLTKSTLDQLRVGAGVNLERSLKFSERLGGHLVQGHINGIGRIKKIEKLGENYFMHVEIPADLRKYIVSEGSIALDGISLTIAEAEGDKIGLSIIPHTWENTTLKYRKPGDILNVETDIIARYIEKLIKQPESSNSRKLSDTWLKELGY